MTYAFPHNTVVVDKEGGIVQHHKGMELRDYFAAKALSGLINYSPEPDEHEAIAKLCYSLADAMMKARKA
jgi:hypothetical protein